MKLKQIVPMTALSLVLSLVLSAQALRAQSTALVTAVPTPAAAIDAAAIDGAAPSAGPRLDQARAGFTVTRAAESGAFDPAPQPSISRKRGVPQMIIGGAAILGGAIVGGDAGGLVSLAGLGYGLYGLYLYLQ